MAIQQQPEKPDKTELLNDQWDVMAEWLTLHVREMQKIISEDFVQCVLDADEKLFIKEQFRVAVLFGKYIKDPEIAKDLFSFLINELKMITILNRNSYENPMLDKMLPKEREDREERGEIERVIGKLTADKREG